MSVTVGIKRAFLPGYKKYKVERFLFRKAVKVEEPDGTIATAEIDMWLVLLLTNGRDLIIPQIEKKQWCIYPSKDMLDTAKEQKEIAKEIEDYEVENGIQVSVRSSETVGRELRTESDKQ